MSDTLVPATLDEVMARGDTYESTWSIEEGADLATAVPVDISAREYVLTVRHPETNAVLAQITTTETATGVITRQPGGVVGRLRWRVNPGVTAAWPVEVLKRDLEETDGGHVQTLLLGTIQVKEDQST